MRLSEINAKDLLGMDPFGEKGPTIEDVKNDHPEIYAFMQVQIGQMSLDQQAIVDMTDNPEGHLVSIILRPPTSLEFIHRRLTDAGVEVGLTDMMTGSMLSGDLPFAFFRVTIEGRTETWEFQIPNQ